MRIDNRKFVKVWVDAKKNHHGLRYVSEQLNANINTVGSKATYLRSKGVKLPKLYGSTKTRNQQEIEDLNRLIEKNVN